MTVIGEFEVNDDVLVVSVTRYALEEEDLA
jgi:hypothetical protein